MSLPVSGKRNGCNPVGWRVLTGLFLTACNTCSFPQIFRVTGSSAKAGIEVPASYSVPLACGAPLAWGSAIECCRLSRKCDPPLPRPRGTMADQAALLVAS
ncbi:hypothetical protein N657DRAFT_135688 [Parathielavia appendiculata]|uniref:Uncharacterized protein n=1 Tax=Parathielavia appendiculata TaxID=2587402 RepID=A0AAN6TUP0_9PEZI|nr:hypothetical protein N657DRAFT_135688 [Parathielavia appendiculata]